MPELFNKTFWKFACGFVGILIFGILIFVVIGYAGYRTGEGDNTARVTEKKEIGN